MMARFWGILTLSLVLAGCSNVMAPSPPDSSSSGGGYDGSVGIPGPDGTVAVTGVSLDTTEISLLLLTSYTATLTPTVMPLNATNQTVLWSSSNSTIASVDALGLVTAHNTGTVTIQALTQDGG
ncbi:MAG: Ig-like domain-containing protein, partial [Treponema sp.]|nr:Ig-like domain-containing protein [Treponema sp.]